LDLKEAIGIAVMMVALRDTSSVGALRNRQLSSRNVRGMPAHQENNTQELGNNKQSDEQRTQVATPRGHWDRPKPL
jgi:hypothetical protein